MTEFEQQVAEALWAILYAEPELESHVAASVRLAPRVAAAIDAVYGHCYSGDNDSPRRTHSLDAGLRVLRGEGS